MSTQIASNRENDWPDLETKEKLFLHRYAESYVIKDASKASGLSKHRGSTLLRQPLAMAYLNELQDINGQRSVITRDFINLQWLKLMPKLLGEEDVQMVDKDGCSFLAKKFHASEAVRTMTELSKSTNFYADGSGQSASVSINIDLGALGIVKKEEKVINPHAD